MQLWETSSSLQTCEMWNIAAMEVFLSAYKPERKPLRRVRGSCLRQSWERRDDLLHSKELRRTPDDYPVEKRSVELGRACG
jgi:hypothetical protein